MGQITDNATILIVDDTPHNITMLTESLKESYTIIVATSGRDALEVKTVPDLILLDIIMPGMDGFEVCEHLKQRHELEEVPIIFLTSESDIHFKTRGFELGAVDYITKPFDMREVRARVHTHLTGKYARDFLNNQNQILEEMVGRRTREIESTRDAAIRIAASLAESRDNETGAHILRTQGYMNILSGALSEEAGFREELTPDNRRLLVKSAPLHDIGKIGVPDAILLKPGKLTDPEFFEMKKHTIYGYQSLSRAEQDIPGVSFLRYAREIAYSHHEKWDGSGYPEGLKEEGIPLSGRMMAVADVYDALISKRVYKEAFSHDKALSIMREGRGIHFDPGILDCFIDQQDSIRKIAAEYSENG